MQSSWRTCVLNTPPPVSQSFSISARARSCFAPLLRSWAYTRMLVSTKHLSLMQFAARTGSCPAQIQPYAEPRHSPPSSAIISLTFSHEFLELGGKEPADRTAFFRSQDPRLFQNLSVELQSDICFHGCTIPRATQFYVLDPSAVNSSIAPVTFALQRGLWLAHPCAWTFTPTDSTRSAIS